MFHLKKRVKTFTLDTWPLKIDDGELTEQEIRETLSDFLDRDSRYQEIFLACSQFYDLKPELRKIFGHNIKIHDGFSDALREVYKTLRIRGSAKKIK